MRPGRSLRLGRPFGLMLLLLGAVLAFTSSGRSPIELAHCEPAAQQRGPLQSQQQSNELTGFQVINQARFPDE
jgi:hypothetical protein